MTGGLSTFKNASPNSEMLYCISENKRKKTRLRPRGFGEAQREVLLCLK